MFDFKEWLKKSYIDLVKAGQWSSSYCAAKCAEQIDKKRFTNADAEEIFNAIEETIKKENEDKEENAEKLEK